MKIFGFYFDPFNKEKIKRLEIEKDHYKYKAEEYYKEYKKLYCQYKKFSSYGVNAEFMTNLYITGKKYVELLREDPVIPEGLFMITDRFDNGLYNTCFVYGDGKKKFSQLTYVILNIDEMWEEKEKNPEIFLDRK